MVHGFHAGNGSEYVDRRVAQLLHELHVGQLAESRSRRSSDNAPRGAGIRPLLANVFLHYALDLWVRRCRRRHAAGRMRPARYADDFVLPEPQRRALRSSGSHRTRTERGPSSSDGKPPSGIGAGVGGGPRRSTSWASCARTRRGRYMALRKTRRQRMTAKLEELRRAMRLRI